MSQTFPLLGYSNLDFCSSEARGNRKYNVDSWRYSKNDWFMSDFGKKNLQLSIFEETGICYS